VAERSSGSDVLIGQHAARSFTARLIENAPSSFTYFFTIDGARSIAQV